MNHALAAQEADLLPERFTLAAFGRPVDGFAGRPFDGFHDFDSRPNIDFQDIDATNFAIAQDGPAIAVQNITAR